MGSSGDREDKVVFTKKDTTPAKLNGKPTILIVDDDDLIREVAAMMIEEEGGAVLDAGDGAQALSILGAQKEKIDCVFCDFSMPKMNGYEVFIACEKMKPNLPFVIVSGLKIVPEVDELRRSGRIEFVGKPFHQEDLVNAINKARESRG